MARIKFMNTYIDNFTMREAVREIDRLIRLGKPSIVVTPNVDTVVKLEQGGELAEVYRQADLILCDGMPMVWLSKLYDTPIKQKISGSDLFPRLCVLAAKRGYRMFFLGAEKGVADIAAARLKKRFAGLDICGTYSPPVGFEKDENELEKIRQQVKDARPDILILAFGVPKQELFMMHERYRLGVPVSLGLGATLDFEAGKIKRAPKWMSEHGLEWAFRITQDPKRLAKRYLVDDMKIFSLAVKYYPKNRRK